MIRRYLLQQTTARPTETPLLGNPRALSRILPCTLTRKSVAA